MVAKYFEIVEIAQSGYTARGLRIATVSQIVTVNIRYVH